MLYQNNFDTWWLLCIYVQINAFSFLFEQVFYYPFGFVDVAYQNPGDATRKYAVLQFVMWGFVNKQWQEFTHPERALSAGFLETFLKREDTF